MTFEAFVAFVAFVIRAVVGVFDQAERGMRKKNGAETQIRTGDTSLFRAVLYRLSYLGTQVAEPTGFEPAISGVTIQRPRPN